MILCAECSRFFLVTYSEPGRANTEEIPDWSLSVRSGRPEPERELPMLDEAREFELLPKCRVCGYGNLRKHWDREHNRSTWVAFCKCTKSNPMSQAGARQWWRLVAALSKP